MLFYLYLPLCESLLILVTLIPLYFLILFSLFYIVPQISLLTSFFIFLFLIYYTKSFVLNNTLSPTLYYIVFFLFLFAYIFIFYDIFNTTFIFSCIFFISFTNSPTFTFFLFPCLEAHS